MASNSNINEKAERCPSQTAKEHLGHLKDRITNEERLASELDNIPFHSIPFYLNQATWPIHTHIHPHTKYKNTTQ